MKILIAGASGLIGTALTDFLTQQGHAVVRLVRRPAGENEIEWDPDEHSNPAGPLEGFDAAINLCGVRIDRGRWTKRLKVEIRASRLIPTRHLGHLLTGLENPPRVFLNASAVGFYGDRGTEELTEESAAGSGFLPQTCVAWETEADKVRRCRVVLARFGVVLSPRGGALARMLPLFRWGLGGRLGNGQQLLSWISLRDAVRAIEFCLTREAIAGPVNFTAPQAVTNREFTAQLASTMRRPAWLPIPAFALRLALGQMANSLLLASTNAIPKRLLDAGFKFEDAGLKEVLERELITRR